MLVSWSLSSFCTATPTTFICIDRNWASTNLIKSTHRWLTSHLWIHTHPRHLTQCQVPIPWLPRLNRILVHTNHLTLSLKSRRHLSIPPTTPRFLLPMLLRHNRQLFLFFQLLLPGSFSFLLRWHLRSILTTCPNELCWLTSVIRNVGVALLVERLWFLQCTGSDVLGCFVSVLAQFQILFGLSFYAFYKVCFLSFWNSFVTLYFINVRYGIWI